MVQSANMEPIEHPSDRLADAPAKFVLSYHCPTVGAGETRARYLAAAACGLSALLLFSLGIYIVLVMILNSVGTSGWVMISCLVAPFCFLCGSMLLSRVSRMRRMIRPSRVMRTSPEKESAHAC